MNDRHWTDEELIHRLYGVGPEESAREAHLRACPECSRRRQALEQSRADLVQSMQSVVADDARLRAQRDAVWRRLEGARRPWRRSVLWTRVVPTGATALLLAFAVVLYRPTPQPAPKQVAVVQQISDEELFNDIASIMKEDAPRAAKPIQGLFETDSGIEVQ
jgi:anti-sigma factor RsiW